MKINILYLIFALISINCDKKRTNVFSRDDEPSYINAVDTVINNVGDTVITYYRSDLSVIKIIGVIDGQDILLYDFTDSIN